MSDTTPEQTPGPYTSEELIERGIACQHYTPPIICSLCALDLIRAEREAKYAEILRRQGWARDEEKKLLAERGARELLEKQKASLIVERDNALERREKAEKDTLLFSAVIEAQTRKLTEKNETTALAMDAMRKAESKLRIAEEALDDILDEPYRTDYVEYVRNVAGLALKAIREGGKP